MTKQAKETFRKRAISVKEVIIGERDRNKL